MAPSMDPDTQYPRGLLVATGSSDINKDPGCSSVMDPDMAPATDSLYPYDAWRLLLVHVIQVFMDLAIAQPFNINLVPVPDIVPWQEPGPRCHCGHRPIEYCPYCHGSSCSMVIECQYVSRWQARLQASA